MRARRQAVHVHDTKHINDRQTNDKQTAGRPTCKHAYARTQTNKQTYKRHKLKPLAFIPAATRPPIHGSIDRSIHQSTHQSINSPVHTSIHIPPSAHPTLERTHAHPFIPSSTQPSSQPTILASSSQPTSRPSQEIIDRSARFLHGCCRLRATNNALEPEPIKSIFSYQRYSYIPACFIIFPARFLHF